MGILGGCGPKGDLTTTPAKLTWDQVNFAGFPSDMPAEGYDAQAIVLENTGDARLDLVIEDFDFDHLCIEGFADNPVELPPLNVGQFLTLNIGVCGYDVESGERDTLIRGTVDLDDNSLDGPASVPFQFTPVVDQSTGGDDTGR